MKATMKRAWAVAAFWLMAMLTTAAGAGTITYYHNDLAGSPAVATDASGQVIWRESYRPYGERLTNAPASSTNDVWFTSRRQDQETGLVYMGARYYDPVAGRFLSTDPKGFDEANIHTFNRYAYANNNPYRYKDPDGRSPIDVGFAIWDGGKLFGALGAWGMGTLTGNETLVAAGVEGMRETRLDAGISLGAVFLPVSSGLVKGAVRSAEEAAEFAKLSKRLASEAQMGESGVAIAGSGTGKSLWDADRIAAEHGGQAADWAKKTSSSYTAADGAKIQTHWVENANTGVRVEHRTIVTP